EVNVNGVLPVAAAAERPGLDAVLLDGEARMQAVEELIVHRPLAVAGLVEFERALNPRRGIRARQRVVRRQGRRVHAVVGYLRQIDDDLEQQAALARGLDVAGGAAAI